MKRGDQDMFAEEDEEEAGFREEALKINEVIINTSHLLVTWIIPIIRLYTFMYFVLCTLKVIY